MSRELVCSLKNSWSPWEPCLESQRNWAREPQLPTPQGGPTSLQTKSLGSHRSQQNYPPTTIPTIQSPSSAKARNNHVLTLDTFSWKSPSNWCFSESVRESNVHSLVNAFLYKRFNTFIFNILTWPNLFCHVIYCFMKLTFCYMKLKLISKSWCTSNFFLSSGMWMTEENLSSLFMSSFCYRMINCTVTYITQNISNKAML